jgi:hypothetical protein
LKIPTRYDFDCGRGNMLFPLYRLFVSGMGLLPEIDAQWRWEEARWLGSSTRPVFGLLTDLGPEPFPSIPLQTITR